MASVCVPALVMSTDEEKLPPDKGTVLRGIGGRGRWFLNEGSGSRSHHCPTTVGVRVGSVPDAVLVSCVVSWLLSHVGVMTSEALARVGALGRLVVLKARVASRRGMTGVWLSMVLTSQAHRRCASGRNRRIPTICAGCFDGRIVHVSAVDTGPRKSESGLLTAGPGISATGPPPPSSDRRLRWGPVVMVRRLLCPESA